MKFLRRNAAVLISAFVAFCILCGLGTWQVRRLAWKEGLIAELTLRMKQPAQPLQDGLAEYTRVELAGQLDVSKALYRIGNFRGGPGFEVVAPFKLDDGRSVLVDLGAVADRGVPLQPMTRLDGVVRLHNLGRGFFDPDNNPVNNSWYWWDLPAMQQAAGMVGALPFIVQASSNESGAEAAPPAVELHNNHLGYAITWFGLAAALVGVTATFVFQRKRR